MFYSESENFQFLTTSQVKMGHILPKQKNAMPKSKIFAFPSTFLHALLILIPKRNRVRKSLCSDFASLGNPISK